MYNITTLRKERKEEDLTIILCQEMTNRKYYLLKKSIDYKFPNSTDHSIAAGNFLNTFKLSIHVIYPKSYDSNQKVTPRLIDLTYLDSTLKKSKAIAIWELSSAFANLKIANVHASFKNEKTSYSEWDIIFQKSVEFDLDVVAGDFNSISVIDHVYTKHVQRCHLKCTENLLKFVTV